MMTPAADISELSEVPQMLAFGSTQERQLVIDRPAAGLGPGSYNNHVVGTILRNLQSRPESNMGYVLARTSSRFPPIPQTYALTAEEEQQESTQSKTCSPGRAPFNSSSQRFRLIKTTAMSTPGPGTYAHDTPRYQKVSWPMKFGSPDWSQVPQPKKSATKPLLSDEEFIKHRSRLAYLKLFYS